MKDKNRDIIFNTFFETSCPMLLIDSNGFPVVWNNAADSFIQRNGKKLVIACDHNFWNTIKQILLPEETEHLNAFIRGEKKYWEAEIKYKTLHQKAMWYRLEAFHAEQSETVFCCLRDNTNRHIHEMQLLAEKQNAERETFTKSQFLATMSHEIRTPIQTIIGTADLLSETSLDDEQNEYTQQIRFSADVLLSIINNILDISKMEAGKFILEETPFELEAQMERTLDLIALEAHKKHLDLMLDYSRALPKTIVGDPWRLNQVLLNLLKNAVKFTEEGGITLHVFPIQKNGSTFIEFRVIDTGIGISDEYMQNLFEPFHQGEITTSRKYGGTGLGLAICKNIIELMGGTIECFRNAHRGSTFLFILPLASTPQQVESPFVPKNQNLHILIVDDNPDACRILKKQLRRICLNNVAIAFSGTQALEMLEAAVAEGNPFEVALIDMIMPDMDGWRLSIEINKNKNINNILLYLGLQDGLIYNALKSKIPQWFNGYLYKPVKFRQLVSLINNMDFVSFNLKSPDENMTQHPSLLNRAERLRQQSVNDPNNMQLEQTVEQPPECHIPAEYSVLIAEDHAVNRKLIKTMLQKSGINHLFEAEDGRKAIQVIEKNTPDIVFMDLQMPIMNGYEAAIQMRKNGYTKPIIACTASSGNDEETRCRDCGMSGILVKPFKRKDIVDILEKWISV